MYERMKPLMRLIRNSTKLEITTCSNFFQEIYPDTEFRMQMRDALIELKNDDSLIVTSEKIGKETCKITVEVIQS